MLSILLSRILEYVQLNLTKVATLEEKVRSHGHVREVEKILQAPHLPEGTFVRETRKINRN